MLPTVDGRLFKIKGGNMLLPQVSHCTSCCCNRSAMLPGDQWRQHAAATGQQLLSPWSSWRPSISPPACRAVALDQSVTRRCVFCMLTDVHAASWHGGVWCWALPAVMCCPLPAGAAQECERHSAPWSTGRLSGTPQQWQVAAGICRGISSQPGEYIECPACWHVLPGLQHGVYRH